MNEGNDIIIRNATMADVPGIGRVHVDSWRTTYTGLVPDDYLAGLTYEAAERRWRGWMSDPAHQSIILVAVNPAGEIVGFADGGKDRSSHKDYDGELYALYLLRE